jgi:RimJ/RimL family protein N-acetyltransferase
LIAPHSRAFCWSRVPSKGHFALLPLFFQSSTVAMTPIRLIPAHAGDLSSPQEWLLLGLQDSSTKGFRAALEDVLRQVTEPARREQWGAFWAVESLEGQARAVGLCSYKEEPSASGEVEIAYYTFPHRERRGVATAMVRALTARASPHVTLVIAHTLPVENASCRVLQRCGYGWADEVIDPEDGLVWRWQSPPTALPAAAHDHA